MAEYWRPLPNHPVSLDRQASEEEADAQDDVPSRCVLPTISDRLPSNRVRWLRARCTIRRSKQNRCKTRVCRVKGVTGLGVHLGFYSDFHPWHGCRFGTESHGL